LVQLKRFYTNDQAIILKRNSQMRKSKIVVSIVSVLSLFAGTLLFGLIMVHASTSTAPNTSIAQSNSTPTQNALYPHTKQIDAETTKQKVTMKLVIAPQPTKAPVSKPTATAPSVTMPTAGPVTTQPAPVQSSSGSDRYYPIGTSAATMKADAANLSKQQVKILVESQVNKNWGVIQSKLGFSTEAQAYAFFLGLATRESTLNAGLETGSGAGHSYGAIQAAETAYANTNAGYAPENDVPEMTQYDFTPQNFYDPGIAIHMGIRHLLHFSNLASAAGYSGTELLRHALIGYNTGWVTNSSASWLQQYSDEIGAIAGWYLNNGHLYDSQFTWTGSSAVDRSSPWGWY
jgi:hypothetical protein